MISEFGSKNDSAQQIQSSFKSRLKLFSNLFLINKTENKFDEAAFSKMKRDAIFINIGRGAIVDEEALVKALKNNEIGGCGLDVLREEPIKLDHPLLKMEKAVILQHIGSASVATRDRMIQLCVDNIVAILKGEKPLTPITNK